jgi:hypothetical protein
LFHPQELDVRRRQAEMRAEVARLQVRSAGVHRGRASLVLRRRAAAWLHRLADRVEARDAVRAG